MALNRELIEARYGRPGAGARRPAGGSSQTVVAAENDPSAHSLAELTDGWASGRHPGLRVSEPGDFETGWLDPGLACDLGEHPVASLGLIEALALNHEALGPRSGLVLQLDGSHWDDPNMAGDGANTGTYASSGVGTALRLPLDAGFSLGLGGHIRQQNRSLSQHLGWANLQWRAGRRRAAEAFGFKTKDTGSKPPAEEPTWLALTAGPVLSRQLTSPEDSWVCLGGQASAAVRLGPGMALVGGLECTDMLRPPAPTEPGSRRRPGAVRGYARVVSAIPSDLHGIFRTSKSGPGPVEKSPWLAQTGLVCSRNVSSLSDSGFPGAPGSGSAPVAVLLDTSVERVLAPVAQTSWMARLLPNRLLASFQASLRLPIWRSGSSGNTPGSAESPAEPWTPSAGAACVFGGSAVFPPDAAGSGAFADSWLWRLLPWPWSGGYWRVSLDSVPSVNPVNGGDTYGGYPGDSDNFVASRSPGSWQWQQPSLEVGLLALCGPVEDPSVSANISLDPDMDSPDGYGGAQGAGSGSGANANETRSNQQNSQNQPNQQNQSQNAQNQPNHLQNSQNSRNQSKTDLAELRDPNQLSLGAGLAVSAEGRFSLVLRANLGTGYSLALPITLANAARDNPNSYGYSYGDTGHTRGAWWSHHAILGVAAAAAFTAVSAVAVCAKPIRKRCREKAHARRAHDYVMWLLRGPLADTAALQMGMLGTAQQLTQAARDTGGLVIEQAVYGWRVRTEAERNGGRPGNTMRLIEGERNPPVFAELTYAQVMRACNLDVTVPLQHAVDYRRRRHDNVVRAREQGAAVQRDQGVQRVSQGVVQGVQGAQNVAQGVQGVQGVQGSSQGVQGVSQNAQNVPGVSRNAQNVQGVQNVQGAAAGAAGAPAVGSFGSLRFPAASKRHVLGFVVPVRPPEIGDGANRAPELWVRYSVNGEPAVERVFGDMDAVILP